MIHSGKRLKQLANEGKKAATTQTAAQADRKRAEAAFKGYALRGTYGTSAMEEMHLHSAEKQYRDNGYDVLKHIVILSDGRQGIRLYVKKLKVTRVPVKRKVTGKAIRSTKAAKAKAKKFTKAINVSGKRYTLASTFGPYGDRAKAYARELKDNYDYSSRVKSITVNGNFIYAVYTRSPARSRRELTGD